MMGMMRVLAVWHLPVLGLWFLAVPGAAAPSSHAEPVSFNRHVRPILSENCFACHGPDANTRKAGRRLDTREGALAEEDGIRAIVPGAPQSSELVARLRSTDPDAVMPPPELHKSVTPEERSLIEQWIAEGAEYEPHWSYIPPRRRDGAAKRVGKKAFPASLRRCGETWRITLPDARARQPQRAARVPKMKRA